MPPIQQQQTSRGGLITALVVTIVLLIGSLVWAVMTNADLNKLQQESKVKYARYDSVIASNTLGDLDTYRIGFSADPANPRDKRTFTLIDAANEQRKELVKLITGSDTGSQKDAADKVAQTIKDMKANTALADVKIPEGAGLVGAIQALSSRSTDDSGAVAKIKADLATANATLASEREAHKAELAKRDQAVEAEKANQAKLVTDTSAAIAEKDKQVAESAKAAEAATKEKGDAAIAQTGELQTRDRKIAELDKLLQEARIKISQVRPSIKDAMVRNVDATITQTSPDNICYINLGFGDHVTPGTTFEVYDKHDGVPKLGDGTDTLNMPKGKASIEIISVGQNSSQCRIISTRSGTTLSQGDLCVNIAYDKNLKPYFFVYGKFDMDQNGVATDGEAEVVRNLAVRWGGKVSERISIETDFVVLGKEPTIPVYTPEERAQPILKAKEDEAKAALDAYNKIRDEAVVLHIPIMNQNRFLYYTGYFDQAKK